MQGSSLFNFRHRVCSGFDRGGSEEKRDEEQGSRGQLFQSSNVSTLARSWSARMKQAG